VSRDPRGESCVCDEMDRSVACAPGNEPVDELDTKTLGPRGGRGGRSRTGDAEAMVLARFGIGGEIELSWLAVLLGDEVLAAAAAAAAALALTMAAAAAAAELSCSSALASGAESLRFIVLRRLEGIARGERTCGDDSPLLVRLECWSCACTSGPEDVSSSAVVLLLLLLLLLPWLLPLLSD